jgi:uncharacterized protein
MTTPIQVHFVAAGKYHDIDFARLEVLKLLAEHPRLRTSVAVDYADTERLAACDMLITYTCDLMPTPEQAPALRAFLERGGRWFALHGTNSILRFLENGLVDTPEERPDVMELLGTQFKAHPPIGPFKVEVVDRDHALTRGLDDFEVVDELYLSKTTAPIRTLMQTRFTGEATGFVDKDWRDAVVPILYLRDLGRGGVLYITLGHCRSHHDVMQLLPFWPHPERCAWNYPVYYELLRRGLRWAMRELEPA